MLRIPRKLGHAYYLRPGDVLLFRPAWSDVVGRLICVAGRTEYCHAGMVAEIAGDWCCLEMVGTGGRDVPIEQRIDQCGRRGIDLYQPIDKSVETYHRGEAAASVMFHLVARRYGFVALARVALRHLPVLRLLCRAETDDQIFDGRPPICSQAVAAAWRAAGVDPVPQLSDRMTEPGDLARSAFFKYRCTLVP